MKKERQSMGKKAKHNSKRNQESRTKRKQRRKEHRDLMKKAGLL